MAGEILVLVEHAEGKVDSITFQLLAAGRRLATELNAGLVALAIGHRLESVSAALQGNDVDRIVLVDDPALASAAGEMQASVIADVARRIAPRIVLIGYSLVGMELTPAIATKLSMNALTNCVSVCLRDGAVTVTRPVFDSTLHAQIALEENETAVIALQKGSLVALERSSKQSIVEQFSVDFQSLPSHSKVLSISEEPIGDVDITKAEIVVSVGRGIGNEDKIQAIADLAEALGGVLACSRPVVDVGWLPRLRHLRRDPTSHRHARLPAHYRHQQRSQRADLPGRAHRRRRRFVRDRPRPHQSGEGSESRLTPRRICRGRNTKAPSPRRSSS
jgi:electron transfer flavoprotein alpha subunit